MGEREREGEIHLLSVSVLVCTRVTHIALAAPPADVTRFCVLDKF